MTSSGFFIWNFMSSPGNFFFGILSPCSHKRYDSCLERASRHTNFDTKTHQQCCTSWIPIVWHALLVLFLHPFLHGNQIRVTRSLLVSHPGYMFLDFSLYLYRNHSVSIYVCPPSCLAGLTLVRPSVRWSLMRWCFSWYKSKLLILRSTY